MKLENKNNIYDDMTRHDICQAYADKQGEKYNFTDKDWAWVDEYNYMNKKSDKELLNWCMENYG